jgi:RNA polymerase sigma factor (TIGR02999 family)
MNDITRLLQSVDRNEVGSADGLMRAVYAELHALAAARLSHEHGVEAMQATALVSEVWMRLGADHQPSWHNRAHFFGAAAEAMRRILIDRARHRLAIRHGGGQEQVTFDEAAVQNSGLNDDDRLLALSDALDQLTEHDQSAAELVKLRYFGGLNMKDAAMALGISESTAWRWWNYARAWLLRALRKS